MLVVGFTCKTINLMLLLKSKKKRAHLMQWFCSYMHTLTLAVMRKSSKYKKQKLTQLSYPSTMYESITTDNQTKDKYF